MNQLTENPFAILTFMAAPAILTNAASVMSLGTSNRFARAIDRARTLLGEVRGRETDADPEVQLRMRQLRSAKQRALILVRALTAFYLAVGAFAAASLASLCGAALVVLGEEVLRQGAIVVAVCCGLVGVGGLVCGSALLVWETRLALAILVDETEVVGRLVIPRGETDTGPSRGPRAAGASGIDDISEGKIL